MTSLRLAFGLFTRFPMGAVHGDADAVARSTALAPLVGLVLGLVAMTPFALRPGGDGPALFVMGALSVALVALVTGALHLDGLADCADGLGVQGDRDKVHAVMHDPRIGAIGVVGLVLHLITKVALVAACARWPVVVPVACAVARAPIAAELRFFPPATPGRGLFGGLAGRGGSAWALGLVLGAVCLALGDLAGLPTRAALFAPLAAAVVTLAWHRLWMRRLGGLNGDVLGAAIELRELAVYLVLFAAAA